MRLEAKMISWGATMRAILAIAIVAAITTSASAVDYPGPFTGATVVFTDVDESSITDPLATLYDEPVTPPPPIDTLVFEPTTDFAAFAPNGPAGSDVTDGRLVFTVTADEGLFIDTITVNEGGQFLTLGTGSVNAIGTIRAKDVDTALNIGSALNFTFTDVPASGDDGGAWTGTASLDLSQFELTAVQIVIENTLAASIGAENGTAFIDKKDFNVGVTTFIPEPGSLALLGLGMLAMLSRRGRDQD